MSTESTKLSEVSQKNLELVQGNDEVYRFQSKTKNFTTRKFVPYDLANIQEITMIIENKYLGIVYFTGTMTGGQATIESAPDGIYRIEVPASITVLIPVAKINYHVFLNTLTGSKRTAIMGLMRIIDD